MAPKFRTSVTPSNNTTSGVSSSGTRSRMSVSCTYSMAAVWRHDALVVAARQAVELLDRNLLIMQTVAHAKIFQLLHQLPSAPLRM